MMTRVPASMMPNHLVSAGTQVNTNITLNFLQPKYDRQLTFSAHVRFMNQTLQQPLAPPVEAACFLSGLTATRSSLYLQSNHEKCDRIRCYSVDSVHLLQQHHCTRESPTKHNEDYHRQHPLYLIFHEACLQLFTCLSQHLSLMFGRISHLTITHNMLTGVCSDDVNRGIGEAAAPSSVLIISD